MHDDIKGVPPTYRDHSTTLSRFSALLPAMIPPGDRMRETGGRRKTKSLVDLRETRRGEVDRRLSGGGRF